MVSCISANHPPIYLKIYGIVNPIVDKVAKVAKQFFRSIPGKSLFVVVLVFSISRIFPDSVIAKKINYMFIFIKTFTEQRFSGMSHAYAAPYARAKAYGFKSDDWAGAYAEQIAAGASHDCAGAYAEQIAALYAEKIEGGESVAYARKYAIAYARAKAYGFKSNDWAGAYAEQIAAGASHDWAGAYAEQIAAGASHDCAGAYAEQIAAPSVLANTLS